MRHHASHEPAVSSHLAGTLGAAFEAEQWWIAVEVIDGHGNELLVVRQLEDVR